MFGRAVNITKENDLLRTLLQGFGVLEIVRCNWNYCTVNSTENREQGRNFAALGASGAVS